MREFNNVIKFGEKSPELYKTFKDFSGHYFAERAHKPTTGFVQMSLDDKKNAINKLYFKELQRRSGYTLDNFDGSIEKFGSSQVILDFADNINEYLVDMVLPMMLTSSALSNIADFHFVGFGDSLKFTLKSNKLPTVNEVGYRQKHTLTQRDNPTTGTVSLKNYQVTVITNLPAILAGRENIAELIMKAARAIEAKLYYIVYDKFAAAMNTLSTPLKVTNWDEKGAIKLAETVSGYNNGSEAIFMGTPVALKSMLPDAQNTRIDLGDTYNTTLGHMAMFNGYRVVVMPQVPDYDNASTYGLKLDDKKIYCISPAAGKLIQVGIGDSMSNIDDSYDNMNLSILGSIRKPIGAECITNSIAGLITLA